MKWEKLQSVSVDILLEEWHYKKQEKSTVESRQAFFFFKKMGKIAACLYSHGNEPFKRKKIMKQEREENS